MYQVITQVEDLAWNALDVAGVSIRILHKDEATGAMSVVTRMEAGATIPAHLHSKADETVYVLEGDFVENSVPYGPGAIFFGKAQTAHGPHSSAGGCLVLTHFSAELDFVSAPLGSA